MNLKRIFGRTKEEAEERGATPEDLKEGAKDAADTVRREGGEIADKAKREGGDLADKAKDTAESARDRARR